MGQRQGQKLAQDLVQMGDILLAQHLAQLGVIGLAQPAQIGKDPLPLIGQRQDLGPPVGLAGGAAHQTRALQCRHRPADLGLFDMRDPADIARRHGAELAQIGQGAPLRPRHAIARAVDRLKAHRSGLSRLVQQIGQEVFKVEVACLVSHGSAFAVRKPDYATSRRPASALGVKPGGRQDPGLTRSGWAARTGSNASSAAVTAARRG